MITQRQRRLVITSTASVVLTGLILVFANILFNWVYIRLDLTHNHAYSLSPSSKKLVRSLEDPVVIKAYFSPDLPTPYNTYAQYVKDILTEYRNSSRGRVRFEFISPMPAKDFEDKAVTAGMAPLQFEQMGSDQLQIKRGFMGLTLYYRDRSEALPVVKNPDHLEYELTSRIARMAQKNKKKIVQLTGHGELNWLGSQIKLAQDLPAFYDLDHSHSLPQGTTAPIEADALLVVGPRVMYDIPSLWAIDRAIMQGIPTAFFVDSKRFNNNQFSLAPLQTGLDELLSTYGVKLSDRLIYDAQCESVGITQNVGGMAFTTRIRYPYIPQITHFDAKHPILSGVETVSLPFSSSLQTPSLPPGVTFTPLLFSSEKSWQAPPNVINVAPNAIARPGPEEPHGPYVLGGVLEGTFPSHFASRPVPAQAKDVPPIAKSPKTSILVLATSHVLDPGFPEFPGNDAFMTNALAFLSHDETLIGIQSKGDIIRPLKQVPGPVREAIRYGCILGVPLLPVAMGLLRWRRRAAWRKTVLAEFNPPHASSTPA